MSRDTKHFDQLFGDPTRCPHGKETNDMIHRFFKTCRYAFVLAGVISCWLGATTPAAAYTEAEILDLTKTTGVPDYYGIANYANSPKNMLKFVDGLPPTCASGTNNLGQCLPIAVPEVLPDGSHYYEISVVQYREQMHSDLPPVAPDGLSGGTLLRGYAQTNVDPGNPAATPHSLGPVIAAQRDVAVRIKLTNELPANEAGNLFIPVDYTVMGAGPGASYDRLTGAMRDDEFCKQAGNEDECFSSNRALIHLHGGRTPWISDGTAHQWLTPEGETVFDESYQKGYSVANVPDMWYDAAGAFIPSCATQLSCDVAGATNDPGPSAMTYYYTNAQSARMMFYHDHAWGITRLNVYAGEVGGYFITDEFEQELVTTIEATTGPLPIIPLIIQDKTFVDASGDPGTNPNHVENTDPTWIWGSQPGTMGKGGTAWNANFVATTGDLWWPHVYVPAQDPFATDLSGINPYGRWHYGPWFWPPTNNEYGPVPNPYYVSPTVDPTAAVRPPQMPDTPNPSWGAEAFFDTPVINGTAYPTLEVPNGVVRFRILNGAHDRFWNLQLYVASDDPAEVTHDFTEIKMMPADGAIDVSASNDGFPWPNDGREGGVPDPAYRGPALVQIMNDGGMLPKPVVLNNRPVNWNVDVTTFAAGNVLQQNQGGGTLFLGPAQRADILVDFSAFAGKTLILYNDAPAPWPAVDFHYDYYTGNGDFTADGGTTTVQAGYGPNTRTIMQIKVDNGSGIYGADPGTPSSNAPPAGAVNAFNTALVDAIDTKLRMANGGDGLFARGQEPMIVGQSAYNDTYDTTFPNRWPYWGISRITDNAISYMTPDGGLVDEYYMEPKAIQDEQGEVFDEYGRMSAKLGLEMSFTNAGIQTFITQNFVDPPTEIIQQDQIQIWKITHNGVDTHPVHFHLMEVQLLNRVGWDGFKYLPDPNELGWQDTVRIHPLMDTVVAVRPVKVPTPFNVPNSIRPLNPAYPIGSTLGFTQIDPTTGQATDPVTTNDMTNFGHEYLWHCHILSHEEQDMMRVISLNANGIVYSLNGPSNGIWEWNMGEWRKIADLNPTAGFVSHGSFAYAGYGNGVWEWNGYEWKQITTLPPESMVVSSSGLYAQFSGFGLFRWHNSTWTMLNNLEISSMLPSSTGLYVNFNTIGLFEWTPAGNWTMLTNITADSMVADGSTLFAYFAGAGLFQWNNSTWTLINTIPPGIMVSSGSDLYTVFDPYGLYQWDGAAWNLLTTVIPTSMTVSGPELYASFGASGLFRWAGAWNYLIADEPSDMVSSGSVLYANFPGTGTFDGVYKWETGLTRGVLQPGAWSPLYNTTPVTNLSPGY